MQDDYIDFVGRTGNTMIKDNSKMYGGISITQGINDIYIANGDIVDFISAMVAVSETKLDDAYYRQPHIQSSRNEHTYPDGARGGILSSHVMPNGVIHIEYVRDGKIVFKQDVMPDDGRVAE